MNKCGLILFSGIVPALSGCAGIQSALDPAGPAAATLFRLIWSFSALCLVIWMLVIAALAATIVRQPQARPEPLRLNHRHDLAAQRIVAIATLLTAIVLVVLTLASFLANRSLAAIGNEPGVTIEVIGHQWWWELRYQNDEPSKIVTTANEIHIPIGEPIRLVVSSTDVIHSFWVPSLAGKLDLIPGRSNILTLQADTAGIYRGQCAEFCGAQHAHMGMLVVAEPRPVFEAWLNHQLEPAQPPRTASQEVGQHLFLIRTCVMCHRIAGTLAGGTVGPNLTHIASRKTLAAAALPMSRGSLAAWLADPQGIKTGAHMPTSLLDGDELNQIVAYLEHLK